MQVIRAGIWHNGNKYMQNTKIKHIISKEHDDAAGIDGWHKLSICDTRHPIAKKIEADIENESKRFENGVRAARQDKFRLLATLGLPHEWSDFAREQVANLNAVIQDIQLRKDQTLRQLYRQLQDLTLVNQLEVHNIIPTAGRAVIARWITGDNTYSGDDGANYGSLGTSATAPANGNTQLTAETYRKATSSVARSNNIAYLSNFYTATEVTGTFEEAGWHIAGTGTANTGQLLSHFLTTTIAKTSTETLTVESTLTIS
jgi:hypothetical protein